MPRQTGFAIEFPSKMEMEQDQLCNSLSFQIHSESLE